MQKTEEGAAKCPPQTESVRSGFSRQSSSGSSRIPVMIKKTAPVNPLIRAGTPHCLDSTLVLLTSYPPTPLENEVNITPDACPLQSEGSCQLGNFVVEASQEEEPLTPEITQTWTWTRSPSIVNSTHSICCAACFPPGINLDTAAVTSTIPAKSSNTEMETGREPKPSTVEVEADVSVPQSLETESCPPVPTKTEKPSNSEDRRRSRPARSPVRPAEYQSGGVIIQEIPSDQSMRSKSSRNDNASELPIIQSNVSIRTRKNEEAISFLPHEEQNAPCTKSNLPVAVPVSAFQVDEHQSSFHSAQVGSRCMAYFPMTVTSAGQISKPRPLLALKPPTEHLTKRRTRLSRLPKPVRPRRTYEDYFVKKKILEEKGPSALRSYNHEAISRSQNMISLHSEHKAVYTKVITKTITEYEMDDKGRQRQVKKRKCATKGAPPANSTAPSTSHEEVKHDTCSDSQQLHDSDPAPRRQVVPKSATMKKKVKLVEPSKSDDMENASHTDTDTPENPESETKEIRKAKAETRIPKPKVYLPGHRDPIMEVPPVSGPAGDSDNKEALRVCKCCRTLKTWIRRSEDTIRYLTELLNIKEEDLSTLIQLISSGEIEQGEEVDTRKFLRSRQTAPLPNPLLAKLTAKRSGNNKSTSGPAQADDGSNGTTAHRRHRHHHHHHHHVIPFDMDEFIRKFFRHSLYCSDEFTRRTIAPFDHQQIFRLMVAMRDAMTRETLQIMKRSKTVLRNRYDNLLALPGSLNDNEVDVVLVIESYRKYAEYIYTFVKESLDLIYNFEMRTIPLHEGASPPDYTHHTTMTLDGVEYSGVFIPMSKVS